jgi:uncharacterized protein YbjT (DUF2867 family)
MAATFPLKIILTGATGMVGEGVLQECLKSEAIGEVLILGRRSAGIAHPKVHEVVLPDLMDVSPIAGQLSGYDACFFCLGVSSIGMKEPEYARLTYDLTLGIARVLAKVNAPAITGRDGMTFCYISGAGTDSTEKGRSMWARVKGRTENELMKLPFKAVYNFRPPFMKPAQGAKNLLPAYKWVGWMYRPGRALFPKAFIELRELGRAMIRVAGHGAPRPVVEALDIVELAKL